MTSWIGDAATVAGAAATATAAWFAARSAGAASKAAATAERQLEAEAAPQLVPAVTAHRVGGPGFPVASLGGTGHVHNVGRGPIAFPFAVFWVEGDGIHVVRAVVIKPGESWGVDYALMAGGSERIAALAGGRDSRGDWWCWTHRGDRLDAKPHLSSEGSDIDRLDYAAAFRAAFPDCPDPEREPALRVVSEFSLREGSSGS